MKNTSNASRRKFFKVGLGLAGTVVAGRSLASVCNIATGEQPLGPFFPNRDTPEIPVRENPEGPIYLANDNDLTFVKGKSGSAKGQVVHIEGIVRNSLCQPLANATLIIWQASSTGRYNHLGDGENHDFYHPISGKLIRRHLDPNFQYWGKARTNEKGEYSFKTIVPGFYPANLNSGWYRPPHIHVMVSATGHEQFVTQMYFRGSEIKNNDWIQELNQKDFLLQNPNMSEEQKENLIVNFNKQSNGQLKGKFDIDLL